MSDIGNEMDNGKPENHGANKPDAAGASASAARQPQREQKSATPPDARMSALSNVPVEIQVVLGTARMSIGNILNLGRGAVVEIDRKVGEQVDIQINHRPVARGEIIIVDEDRLGVTLTEIINIQAGLQ
jgi:flagellar motor switch protein FliN